jgi:hypothetical protein
LEIHRLVTGEMRTGPQLLLSKAILTAQRRWINGEVRLANKRVPPAETQTRRFLIVALAAIREVTRHEAGLLMTPASATSTAMRSIHVVPRTTRREGAKGVLRIFNSPLKLM